MVIQEICGQGTESTNFKLQTLPTDCKRTTIVTYCNAKQSLQFNFMQLFFLNKADNVIRV